MLIFPRRRVERKSTSGSCLFVGGFLISWNSKKQNSIALSTTEAEYIASGFCVAQILWIKNQLEDNANMQFINEFIWLFGETKCVLSLNTHNVVSKQSLNLPILRLIHELKGIMVNKGRIHGELGKFERYL